MASSIETRLAPLLRMRELTFPLIQALTETAPLIDADSACASRWIICSIRLYAEVAELEAEEVEDPDATGVVSETFEPSA